ncbi:MAG: hypothetical protein QGI05_03535, partial [Candidatus Omnitrophota bacterium]|nr:hypothetical protein [Candidatus Omnitrophota bacterium]
MTETIFKKTGIINQLFLTSFFKISNGKFLSKSAAVLIALSSKNKKQQAIAKASKLSAREVSKILNRLTEMDIIARNGSFYNFKDKLFRFWLQSVYLKRILSFSIDEQIEEDYFKKGIMNRFEVFIQESNKELSAKIIDLFKLFKNDIIQLNGKKHKFIPFSQVEKIDRDPASYLNILAQNDKFNWLCTVKKDYIAENDITKIIENTKSPVQNNRINRHVLLCLSGIDENAYLVAKEAKLWVWDIEGLNTLMELYGKPYISL